jgi:hypothetical protein
MPRFLVRLENADQNRDGTQNGLLKLLEILDQVENGIAVIVVPNIGAINQLPLPEILQDLEYGALIGNRVLHFQGNRELHLCSSATLRNFGHGNLYLMLFPSPDVLAQVEDLPGNRSVIVVGFDQQTLAWRQVHDPELI